MNMQRCFHVASGWYESIWMNARATALPLMTTAVIARKEGIQLWKANLWGTIRFRKWECVFAKIVSFLWHFSFSLIHSITDSGFLCAIEKAAYRKCLHFWELIFKITVSSSSNFFASMLLFCARVGENSPHFALTEHTHIQQTATTTTTK